MGIAERRNVLRGHNVHLYFLTLFTLFLLIPGFCSGAGAGEWRGWRGLSNEGISQSPRGPINWSPDRNILWKTPIPGKGHSSPVVSEDNVFVTTAYFTGKGQTLKQLVKYGVFALTIFLAGLAIPFVFSSCKMQPKLTKRQFFSVAGFCLIMGGLICFLFTGHMVLGEDKSDHSIRQIRWLFSSGIVSLCFILTTFQLPSRSRARLVIGVIAILFSGFVLFGRPDPEYYRLLGGGFFVKPTIQTGAIPLVIGITLLLGTLLRREGPSDNSKGALLMPLVLAGGAFILGLLWPGIPLVRAAYRVFRQLLASGSFSVPGIGISVISRSVAFFAYFAIIGFYLIVWLIVEAGNLRQGQARLSHWFTIGILCLSILGFIENNYLLLEKEFVRAIVCVDRGTGVVKWVCEGLQEPQIPTHTDNSPASPTPIIDGNRIYAYFGSPGLMCSDLEGNILWTNTELPFEDIHGVGASPVLSDGLIIIESNMSKAPYITALDCKTGKKVCTKKLRAWKGVHGGYRTPLVKSIDGKKVVLVWGKFDFRAYNVHSGEELWRYPIKHSDLQMIASIISDGDCLYLPNRRKFRALSLSKLSRGEYPVLWTTDMKGKGPNIASPVLCKGMLFMVSDHGDAHCLDAKTGEVLWRERLPGTYMSSLVVVGNFVYLCNISGLTTVLACEASYRKIAENDLSEPIYASPAPVDGQLFIRTTKHLWCIQEQ